MPVRRYGLLKGRLRSIRSGDNPLSELLVEIDGDTIIATVNDVPRPGKSELVYWRDSDCAYRHAQFLTELSTLNTGFYPRSGTTPALDLVKGGWINLGDAQLVPHNPQGKADGILSEVTHVMQRATYEQATVYVFGSLSNDACSLHNVHLNQGSSGDFYNENGASQDGAILIEFSDGDWEAIIVAFTSQSVVTDERGNPRGSMLLEEIGAAIPNQNLQNAGAGSEVDNQTMINTTVKLDLHADPTEQDLHVIRTRTETCQHLFKACQQDRALSNSDWIDKMSAKFNWWSLGIGAAKRGHSSLDYRVRTREDIRNLLVNLLDSLSISLRKCAEIGKLTLCRRFVDKPLESYLYAYLAHTLSAEIILAQLDATQTKEKRSQDIITNDPETGAPDEDSDLGEQAYYTATTIEYLAKISAAIRKSGTKFRHQRVDKLITHRATELEQFRIYLVNIILIGPMQISLLDGILYRHTTTCEPIWKKTWTVLRAYLRDSERLSQVQNRLVQANLVRRNRFDLYFAAYNKKTGGPSLAATKSEQITRSALERQNSQSKVTPVQDQDHQDQQIIHKLPSVDRPVLLSQPATDIGSLVIPQRPQVQQPKSVGTRVSHGALKQDYPKCPAPEGEDFWCPYCAQPLDNSYSDPKKNRRWRYV